MRITVKRTKNGRPRPPATIKRDIEIYKMKLQGSNLLDVANHFNITPRVASKAVARIAHARLIAQELQQHQ